jgi:hypothetical protein
MLDLDAGELHAWKHRPFPPASDHRRSLHHGAWEHGAFTRRARRILVRGPSTASSISRRVWNSRVAIFALAANSSLIGVVVVVVRVWDTVRVGGLQVVQMFHTLQPFELCRGDVPLVKHVTDGTTDWRILLGATVVHPPCHCNKKIQFLVILFEPFFSNSIQIY